MDKKQELYNATWWLWILTAWMALLTIGVVVNFLSGIETESPAPREMRTDGLLRYEGGQIRAYYDWGNRCANIEVREALGFNELRNECADLMRYYKCLESGGHKWRFLKKEEQVVYLASEPHVIAEWYVFSCANCKKKKSKSIDGLTCEERDALQELNILGD